MWKSRWFPEGSRRTNFHGNCHLFKLQIYEILTRSVATRTKIRVEYRRSILLNARIPTFSTRGSNATPVPSSKSRDRRSSARDGGRFKLPNCDLVNSETISAGLSDFSQFLADFRDSDKANGPRMLTKSPSYTTWKDRLFLDLFCTIAKATKFSDPGYFVYRVRTFKIVQLYLLRVKWSSYGRSLIRLIVSGTEAEVRFNVISKTNFILEVSYFTPLRTKKKHIYVRFLELLIFKNIYIYCIYAGMYAIVRRVTIVK